MDALPASHLEKEWIARCRFLRGLPEEKALTYLRSMRKAWDELLDHYRPVAVFSEAIDSYVISTLENSCSAKSVPFFGLVTSFINGYCRVTRYGEIGTARNPSANEVAAGYELLTDIDYQPAFLAQRSQHRKVVFKAWMKNWARFFYCSGKMILPKNRERNHIVGAFHTSRSNLHLWPRLDIDDEDWIQKLESSSLSSVFVPLQFVPEATIDYWSEDVNLIMQDDVLVDFIGMRAKQLQFVVKEHPNAQGLRLPRLYDRLKKIENVVLVPTTTPVQQVMRHIDSILTWTGTVGFQGALQGKPVFNFCKAYYVEGRFFKVIDVSETVEAMRAHIERVSSQTISKDEQLRLIAYTLSGLVPGALRFGHQFSKPTKDEETRYRDIGAEIMKIERTGP